MIFSRKSALTRCALALGLVTLLNVYIEAAKERDNSMYHLRPRLGYFSKSDGYLKIYEEYFQNVVQRTNEAMADVDENDWRHVRPTGQLCVDFMQGFQFRNYKLNKPYEIIPLDACLNWLFDDSSEKQTDLQQLNSAARSEAGRMASDEKFKEIYASTGFKDDQIPKDLKEKLHDYFAKLLKVFFDNPKNGCHGFWLAAYNDFIEDVYLNDCDDETQCVYFGYPNIEKDSYLDLIVESTKQSSKVCYNVMLKQMTGLMHQTAYDRIKKSKSSEATRMSKEMIKILQLVGGEASEKSVNLAQASKELALLKRSDQDAAEKFTGALSQYADSEIKKKGLADPGNDSDGRARFGKVMTKLCNPYIDPTSFLAQTGGSMLYDEDGESKRKPFEFYHLIYSLIRLTNHAQIYGISKEKFEEDVLRNGWQALYLATFACQLISTTFGELDYDANLQLNHNQGAYNVYLRPNYEVLVEDWPIDLIAGKLLDQKNQEPEPVTAPATPSRLKFPMSPPSSSSRSPGRMKNPISAPPSRFKDTPETFDPDSTAFRPTLRFKNPLQGKGASDMFFGKRGKLETVEEKQPEKGSTYGIPKQLDQDILEMFKSLHGHYPKNKPGEEAPKADRNLEGVFPQEMYNAPPTRRKISLFDSSVPLAFNFDSHFVEGKKLDEEDEPKGFYGSGMGYAATRWAAMNDDK